MKLNGVEALSPKLSGPLPKRGGMPCPVVPWLKGYTGLSPIGHLQASEPHWDPSFLLNALAWGGRELLQCEQLHVSEHPTFVLPHFRSQTQGHTLVTPPGDFTGPDAFALLLGLARESEKTLRTLSQSNSPAEAINQLAGPHGQEWTNLESEITLTDILQDLSVGGVERFVSWAKTDSNDPPIETLLSQHQGPVALFCGQTHRIWDGISPFPLIFDQELLSFSGAANDRMLGLDLLRTYHPEIEQERLQTESGHGISCFGEVIAIQCAQINLKQAAALFVPALKKLKQQNYLLLLAPPKTNTLASLLQRLPAPLKHAFVMMEGPSYLKDMVPVHEFFDVRQRKTVTLGSKNTDGVRVNSLPSLGFLPGDLQGHFVSLDIHILELLQRYAQNQAGTQAYFTPMGNMQVLSRMSLNVLTLCGQ